MTGKSPPTQPTHFDHPYFGRMAERRSRPRKEGEPKPLPKTAAKKAKPAPVKITSASLGEVRIGIPVGVSVLPSHEPSTVPTLKPTPVKKGPGRPSMLTRELMDELASRLALRSLYKVCDDDDMPERMTVWRWLTKGDHDILKKEETIHAEFVTVYAHARARRADAYMEDAERIIDDGTNDWMEKEGKHGTTYMALNHEHVSRSKLRFEGRMKLAEKINPKKYAPMQKHADAEGEKLPAPGEVNDLELARRIAFVLEKAKGKVE